MSCSNPVPKSLGKQQKNPRKIRIALHMDICVDENRKPVSPSPLKQHTQLSCTMYNNANDRKLGAEPN